jgi:hypothetical protein
MSQEERRDVHRRFLRDEVRIVVATVAFGMGIDKKDIRGVLNYGAPKNLEGYIQQAGRAGRDGDPAKCVLLWKQGDFSTQQFLISKDSNSSSSSSSASSGAGGAGGGYSSQAGLQAMQRFCMTSQCRRKQIVEYFGERTDALLCTGCDVCEAAKSDTNDKTVDFAEDARLLLGALELCKHYGATTAMDVVRGSESKEVVNKFARDGGLPYLQRQNCYGKGRGRPAAFWPAMLNLLVGNDLAKAESRTIERAGNSKVTYTVYPLTAQGVSLLRDSSRTLIIPVPLDMAKFFTGGGYVGGGGSGGGRGSAHPDISSVLAAELDLQQPLGPDEMELFDELVVVRDGIAASIGMAAATVCLNARLRSMAASRPSTAEALLAIDGVTEAMVQRCGEAFLRAIRAGAELRGLGLDAGLPAAAAAAQPATGPLGGAAHLLHFERTLGERLVVSDDRSDSWERVFTRGEDIRSVAANRPGGKKAIQPTTVCGHLSDCLDAGFLSKLPPAGMGRSAALEATAAAAANPRTTFADLAGTYFESASALFLRKLGLSPPMLRAAFFAVEAEAGAISGGRGLSWRPAALAAGVDGAPAAPAAMNAADELQWLDPSSSGSKLKPVFERMPGSAAFSQEDRNAAYTSIRLWMSLLRCRTRFLVDVRDMLLGEASKKPQAPPLPPPPPQAAAAAAADAADTGFTEAELIAFLGEEDSAPAQSGGPMRPDGHAADARLARPY